MTEPMLPLNTRTVKRLMEAMPDLIEQAIGEL